MTKKSTEKTKPFKFTKAQLKWLEALESGEYKQGRGWLHLHDDKKGDKFCCLGVACNLFERRKPIYDGIVVGSSQMMRYANEDGGHTGSLPYKVQNKLKFRTEDGELQTPTYMKTGNDRTYYVTSLVNLNDELKWSFKKIAKWIRANPEQVFTNNDKLV